MNNQIVRLIALAIAGVLIAFGVTKFVDKGEVVPEAAQEQTAEATTAPAETNAADVAVNNAAADPAATAPATTTETSTVNGFFNLVDENGVAVSSSSWGPVYRLVFFGFANCPDVCPMTLQKIATAMNGLGAEAQNIQPLFITIDPARDTAEALKAYTDNFHPKLIGLTGTAEQVDAAVKNYKAFATRVDDQAATGGYTMDHSGFIYLMRPDDTLVTAIAGSDDAAIIQSKIATAMAAERANAAAVNSAAPQMPSQEPATPTEQGTATVGSAMGAVQEAMPESVGQAVESMGAAVEQKLEAVQPAMPEAVNQSVEQGLGAVQEGAAAVKEGTAAVQQSIEAGQGAVQEVVPPTTP